MGLSVVMHTLVRLLPKAAHALASVVDIFYIDDIMYPVNSEGGTFDRIGDIKYESARGQTADQS